MLGIIMSLFPLLIYGGECQARIFSENGKLEALDWKALEALLQSWQSSRLAARE
jgi:hypothetical protein